jgi:hypothetical protein
MVNMEQLAEHQQPSSDARLAKWLGAFAVLTAAALAIRRSRTLADD